MRPLTRKKIERALLYIRAFEGLEKAGQAFVSSRELAQILGLTADQIRKEISNFGKVGRPRFGYDTVRVKKVLQDYLLKGKTVRAVLFGVGNLGRAVLRYPGFLRGKVKFIAAFDRDRAVIGKSINGVRVSPAEAAPAVIRRTRPDIGIIAVPDEASQGVANLLVKTGIKGIVNFAPRSIRVPENVLVNDIDLTIEFLSLYCDMRFTRGSRTGRN
jgi:redox-sensing transcriptional repressor